MSTTTTRHPRSRHRTGAETGNSPTIDRHSRRWWALAFLALSEFLVVLDASIVNIAIPSLGTNLGLDQTALAWVITAYVLPFGSLLLLGGRLADRFGHRRVFLTGTGGFIAASALAGLSSSGGMLLAARAVQGATAALLAPAALALVTQLFTNHRERSKALGIWGAVAGAGSAAGVLLGGVLTASFGWPAVFYVNVPIGAAVLIALPFLVGRDTQSSQARLDIAGAATATGALVAIVGALTTIEQLGFSHPLVFILLAVAAVLAVTFVLVERRSASPLVPFAIFSNRSVSAGNIAMLFVGGTMVALFFALSVFLQEVLGFGALAAGLSQLPLAVALIIAAGVAPPLVTRVGRRPVLAASLVIFAAGLIWLAFAPSDAVFAAHVLGPTIVIGVGLGGAFVTTTELAVHGVDGSESGLAGGLLNTSQQVGGALGLAILAGIATTQTDRLLHAGSDPNAALAGGFTLLYVGAATFALIAAVVVLALRERQTGRPVRQS